MIFGDVHSFLYQAMWLCLQLEGIYGIPFSSNKRIIITIIIQTWEQPLFSPTSGLPIYTKMRLFGKCGWLYATKVAQPPTTTSNLVAAENSCRGMALWIPLTFDVGVSYVYVYYIINDNHTSISPDPLPLYQKTHPISDTVLSCPDVEELYQRIT